MKTEDAFKKLKISYVGNNFKEWFYPLKFDPKNKVKKLISQKLPRAMNDKEILAELKPTEVSMEEIVATLKTLDHSVLALFYCRDKNSLLRAVRVSWSDDGWCVFAGGVARPGAWFGGRQVFSRNSCGAKILGTSDTLPLGNFVTRKEFEEFKEKVERILKL